MRDHARLHFEGDERFAALLILADGAVEPGANGEWRGCLALADDGLRCNERPWTGPYCPLHKPCEDSSTFKLRLPTGHETLYFITDGSGYIKVGRSQDPVARIRELQTGNPRKLTLLRSVGVPTGTETRIHAMLRECHANGEWFEDCAALQEILGASRDELVRRAWGFQHTYAIWARRQLVDDTWGQVIGREALDDFLREQALDGGLAPRAATSGL